MFGLAHLAPPFWFAQTFRSGYTVQLLNLRGGLTGTTMLRYHMPQTSGNIIHGS